MWGWMLLFAGPLIVLVALLPLATRQWSAWSRERMRALKQGDEPDHRIGDAARVWSIVLIVLAVLTLVFYSVVFYECSKFNLNGVFG